MSHGAGGARGRRLARIVSVACALSIAGIAAGTPTVTESGSAITVDNGLVSFRIDKSDAGVDSLKLAGQELLGGGGILYMDANTGPSASYWRMGVSTAASYAVTTGADHARVTMSTAAGGSMNADVEVHYVLRDGETGVHAFVRYVHSAAMSDLELVQTRLVLRANPSLFTHKSVTDTRGAIMPTPAEHASGTVVQDATILLDPGTAYEAETGRDVYTKYDWSLDEGSRDVIGFTGSAYGAWIVQPHREGQTGGPEKQHLTVHQTSTTPVLLAMLQSTHYGTPGPIVLSGSGSRLFGPFYLHLNAGPDPVALRADAQAWNDPALHRGFYDGLGIPDWEATAGRSDVSGTLTLDGIAPVASARIVLGDDGEDFQFTRRGYQYDAVTDASGDFLLEDVRPGTYRLSATAPGIYGVFTLGSVVVGSGSALDLGPLAWTLPDAGTDLWQIGVFDRTAEEFRHGANDDYRRWGLWFDYPSEFPSDVDFVVGSSDEAVDWNYAHFERSDAGPSPEWDVVFSGDDVPASQNATLTVAVAGQRGTSLEVLVNDVSIGSWTLPYAGSVIHRSGIRGAYQSREFVFSTDWIQPGTNTLTLRHASPGSSLTEGVLYDALKLEFGGPQVLTAEADASAKENDPTGNYGDKTVIEVRSRSTPGSERQNVGFVRFDVSSVPDPGALCEATLALESAKQSATGVSLYGLNDGAAAQGWDELTMTYDTAPTILGGDGDPATQDLDPTDLTLLATFDHGSSGSFDVATPELLDFVRADTDGLVTFLLYSAPDANREIMYVSREGTGVPPTLTLLASCPAPKPRSCGLLGIEALLVPMWIAWQRRRRFDFTAAQRLTPARASSAPVRWRLH